MLKLAQRFKSGFNSVKTTLAQSVEKFIWNNQQRVDTILTWETQIHSPLQQNNQVEEPIDNTNTIESHQWLRAYTIDFWEKIILLENQDGNIYKIFPAAQWGFITWHKAQQIEALFRTHKRAFFKKLSKPKYVKKRFIEAAQENKNLSKNEQKTIQETQIQKKKTLANRIAENKRKKNLEAIKQRKQKQAEKLKKQKEKEIIHQQNIASICNEIQPYASMVMKIQPWHRDTHMILNQEQKAEQSKEIDAAYKIYNEFLLKMDKSIIQKVSWLGKAKRYNVLREYAKKYINQDIWNNWETKNQQRELHNILDSACEVLLLSLENKKHSYDNSTQWAREHYKQAA